MRLQLIPLCIALLSVANCQPSTQTPQTVKKTEQDEVSLSWFTSSPLKGSDRISKSDAKSFIQHVYQSLDRQIFDPTFKQKEREAQLQTLLKQMDAKPQWTRSEVTQLISRELQELKTSHIRVLDPVEGAKLFRLFEQAPSALESKSAVSAQMRGSIGVLSIKSFIVPQISQAAIAQAKSQLSSAKIILLDLRGNGGGDIPSLIEDVVGADKVMTIDRTRNGLAVQEPVILRGYYNDTTGETAPDLLAEKGYIQWRTRFEAKKDPRPWFILVDDQCGSACEVFAAIAQDNQSAKILGVRTMGAVLAGEAFRLKWQGFALIAPTAQVFSPNGKRIEGVGVHPDIPIPGCANHGSQCLEKAIEAIERVTFQKRLSS